MKWSLRIARFAGINVFVHWTFLILLGWIYFSYLGQGNSALESLNGVWFILALFACVLLHEFGHALTGRRYGIKTERITLLPIGGVASMEKMPEKPIQELWVALAGPAVNVVIALLLFAVLYATDGFPNLEELEASQLNNFSKLFLFNLFVVNVLLVVFNLIPAFPMDGGRVLRALLAMYYDRGRATQIASQIGQFLAIAFVFLGLFYNFWLIFIGIFIYLGAGAEANYESTRAVLIKYQVGAAQMNQFTLLHGFETLDHAVKLLLDGQEKEFLVTEENEIIGAITRDDIIRGLQESGGQTPVRQFTNRELIRLQYDQPLQEAYEEMNRRKVTIAPVYENGELSGVLNQENILEMIMIDKAAPQLRPDTEMV